MDKITLATRMCGLLAGLALLTFTPQVIAAEAPLPETEEEAPESRATLDGTEQALDEVVIYATSGEMVAGMHAESELDEAGIAAYGANTIGDLLSQVAPNVDNSEQGPIILIDGKPAVGRSVNDLPAEAIAKVQVLPPQAAGAIGESPTRRVINVVTKPRFTQGTGNVTARAATAGRGFSSQANIDITKLLNGNIRGFSLYVRQNSPMLEAHRGIVTQSTVVPYDLTGNVLSWPMTGGEIDPDLSAAADVPVTLAGVLSGNPDPALEDFAMLAGIPNVSDMGRYRSLIGDQFNYGMSGSFSRALPRNITLSVNSYVDRSESKSLTGATSTLLHLPASSPFSPFSRDVNIARYLGAPLQQERESTTANFAASLQMQLGKWRLMSDNNFGWNDSTTDSERRVNTAALQAAIDAGTLNPFDTLPANLLDDVLSDHATARGYSASTRAQLSGALFSLPAGKANLNTSVQWQQLEQKSRTVGTNNVTRNTRRTDRIANFNLQLPLLGNPQSQGFGMGGQINGNVRDVTASKPLYTWGTGLNWRYGNRVSMNVGFNREKVSPSPGALNDPIVVIDDYRAYDFVRQETVLVRYITGGNPDLKVEHRDIVNISGNVRPLKTVDFTLNAQYSRTMYRDPMQSLPPPSEDIQNAFPDRYRRDADGRLFEIDARMVNFSRTKNEQFRWGGNFRRAFGVPKSGAASGQPGMSSSGQIITSNGQMIMLSDGSDGLSGAGWRLNANFTHQFQVAYKRLLRPGLPVVDLLSGSAGFGTGQSRHRLNSTIGLAYNGSGMQLNSNWTSGSFVNAGTAIAPNRIDFSSTLRFDLQAFTNLGTFYPNNKPLQGVRISLTLENALDYKQSVKDQNGVTPLRYQPYLLNPLGRTVSLSFRKAFNRNQ